MRRPSLVMEFRNQNLASTHSGQSHPYSLSRTPTPKWSVCLKECSCQMLLINYTFSPMKSKYFASTLPLPQLHQSPYMQIVHRLPLLILQQSVWNVFALSSLFILSMSWISACPAKQPTHFHTHPQRISSMWILFYPSEKIPKSL